MPEAEDAPTVLEVRYPHEFRDATRGIANPREGGAVKEVVIQERVFQGVRLKRGDRVVLPRHDKAFTVVSKDTDPQVVLQRPVALRIAAQVRRERTRGGAWTWEVTGRPDAADADLLPSMRRGDEVLWVTSIQRPVLGTVKTVDVAVRLVSVEVPAERMEAAMTMGDKNVRTLVETADWLHPLSRCSGDSKVPTRTLCEGGRTLDVSEGGSVTSSVWDRPCEHDNDCPYFSARTGRGGCLGGGMCEVPLGVRRVGFRHVDPSRSLPALCWRKKGGGHSEESCDAPVFSLH